MKRFCLGRLVIVGIATQLLAATALAEGTPYVPTGQPGVEMKKWDLTPRVHIEVGRNQQDQYKQLTTWRDTKADPKPGEKGGKLTRVVSNRRGGKLIESTVTKEWTLP